MSNYIARKLSPDEKLIYKSKIAPFLLYVGAIPAVLFVLVICFWPDPLMASILFVIAALCYLVAYIKYSSKELVLTSKRIVLKTGIVSVKTNEINIAKIESVEVNISFMGRILGYGMINIGGTGGVNLICDWIVNVEELRSKIQQVREQPSVPDQLIEMKKLLDLGIVTQEEFDQKKKQLLEL